ncbi:MAG: histidine phosphatase family protein [Candidatus Woesearchaeota archaeon]|nr:histidine phosphatase family protein [Candidatus Woesearchaeota archaeon]
MKLIIARHGETEENAKGICQGQSIGTLSRKGIEQAKKLALRLKDEKIDKIYVSDLKRAKDTAQEIIKHHPKAEITYTPELREKNWGTYEGKRREEMNEADFKNDNYRPEKGETRTEARQRAAKFADKLIKEHNKTILLVTHVGTIMHLMLHLLKKDWAEHEQYMHHNCGLTILEINEKERKIVTLNCRKHLD